MQKKVSEKILVLGIDGMDPSLTRKFLKKGEMPNLKRFIEEGAAREDLVMLGGMPTITPPMWTTLATGAYPNTHGITCFFRQDPDDLDAVVYNLDSRNCKAEPLWNVFAEAGKKTMVWHWPGSSWPATSNSENLSVVDGTQPVIINYGVANVDWEKILVASDEMKEVLYKPHAVNDTAAGCVIENTKEEKISAIDEERNKKASGDYKPEKWHEKRFNILLDENDAEFNIIHANFDLVNSPIKDPVGWNDIPDDAREFTLVVGSGLVRRPCLLLKNDQGVYDKVAIYVNKKAQEPLALIGSDDMVSVIDVLKIEETDNVMKDVEAIRNFRIIEICPNGTRVKLWMSAAMDIQNDSLFHPRELYKEITQDVGYPLPIGITAGMDATIAKKAMLKSWDLYEEWQAGCLNYLIDNLGYEVIFSHLHNVDIIGHQIWPYAKTQEEWANLDERVYQGLLEYVYKQTDNYLGRFLHLLDQGWTIVITSDHGLITPEHHNHELLGECGGVNVQVMEKLGFTAVEKDENGNKLKKIDWPNTKAVAVRGNHIWINLKGRNKTGIVDPKDKYQLEGEIIDALYNYRDPSTGKRLISLAVRNKDAIVFGLNGPDCGDIIFFIDEGFNVIHGDGLPTGEGYFDTSVSPIFVAAGKGIKKGFTTDRIVREADVAPTLAVLGGVRMPAQCEGAPIYQIIEV